MTSFRPSAKKLITLASVLVLSLVSLHGQVLSEVSEGAILFDDFKRDHLGEEYKPRKGEGSAKIKPLTEGGGLEYYCGNKSEEYDQPISDYLDRPFPPSRQIARSFTGEEWTMEIHVGYSGFQGPCSCTNGRAINLWLAFDKVEDRGKHSIRIIRENDNPIDVLDPGRLVAQVILRKHERQTESLISLNKLDAYWFRITRKKRKIQVLASSDGLKFSPVLSYEFGPEIDGKRQWFMINGKAFRRGAFATVTYLSVLKGLKDVQAPALYRTIKYYQSSLPMEKVEAEEILKKLVKGEPIYYQNAEIIGDLDLSITRNLNNVIYFNCCIFRDSLIANYATFKKGASFIYCKFLNSADFSYSNFKNGSRFIGAKFEKKAFFSSAILSEADLSEADLSKADLSKADLSGANLSGANLSGAFFEPDPDKLPTVDSIANARGLANLWYDTSSQSLVKLRKSFKEAGYRQQEREITCSLKNSDTFLAWERGGIDRKILAVFNYVFFDLTCKYGISPWRPLALLSFIFLIFFPFYCLALKSRRADTGIWLMLLPDRVLDRALKERPYKLTIRPPFRPLPRDSTRFGEIILRGWRAARLAFYFSLASAFSMGWRELNVGNWISRIQKREYILRPTGWVRTLAGIQSLISAFLLALWAFLYVGSIFE